jgi:GNAT superfamily N-acetyltransferase
MIAIRRARDTDIPALARLRYEFRASLSTVMEDELEFHERFGAWLRVRLGDGSGWAGWVAEAGEELIGTVWIEAIPKMPNPVAEPEAHGYLTNFYVVPRARGSGVGTALMTAALDWCQAQGMHAVILWPTTRTRPLYERHGFTRPVALMERVIVHGHDPGRENPTAEWLE